MDTGNKHSSVDYARDSFRKGEPRAWVLEFLDGEGANKRLAYELRKRPEAKIFLVNYPLSELSRIMGPEDTMIWKEDPDKWRGRVSRIKKHIEQGKDVPPLIATDFWDELHLSDGNHRHQALLELKQEKYWTVFFLQEADNIRSIEAML